MTKLNQILAIEKGTKTRAERGVTDLHKRSEKTALFEGRHGAYRALEEEKTGGVKGDPQPDKVQLVQCTSERALQECRDVLTRLYDVVATKDKTNTETKATVEIDGQVIMEDVPVSFLIYMEKQLNDLETYVRKLPVLPADKEWNYDANQGFFVTEPVMTFTTKKTPRTIVKYEATPEHPAQTEMFMEDITVGEWKTVFQHGGFPVDRKNQVLQNITQLKNAVKFAREEANAVQVTDIKVGNAVFDFLFAK